MAYAVTVDVQIPTGMPRLDELQRIGAISLLEEGFAAVDGVEGPGGAVVDVEDSRVAAHPEGALLLIFAGAPTLEAAESACRALVEEMLERSEVLAGWTIGSCEVQLHPELAAESLKAAAGPDAPPEDLDARRAHLADGRRDAHPSPTSEERAAKRASIEARIRALAPQLKSFDPATFGVLDPEDPEDGEPEDASYATDPADAQLAAGALVWATDVMLDELFGDIETLTEEDAVAADCEGPLLQLDNLPSRYALQYDVHFARRFLVTTTAMTGRFAHGIFESLSCVAEELALRLLLIEAEVTLDTFGLLDDGVSTALDCFKDAVFEDLDHEWLYDHSMDGIDDSPAGDALRIAPMDLPSWFKPFNAGRPVHPYAADEPHAGVDDVPNR